MMTYLRIINLWNRFFIRAPVWKLWPKTWAKWSKIKLLSSSYSFWVRILSSLSWPKNLWTQISFRDPVFFSYDPKDTKCYKPQNWTPQFCVTFCRHFFFFFLCLDSILPKLSLILKTRNIDHLGTVHNYQYHFLSVNVRQADGWVCRENPDRKQLLY